MSKLDPSLVAELQRLSERALQYARDGKIEHAEDVLRRMVKLSTDAQVAAMAQSSPERQT